MTSRIVTLGDEDTILLTAVDGFVQGDRCTCEFLLNFSKPIESRLKLKMVVAIPLGNR